MRKPSTFPILLTILTIFTIFAQANAAPLHSTGTVDVYFSPHDGATNAVVTELNNAKSDRSFRDNPSRHADLLK